MDGGAYLRSRSLLRSSWLPGAPPGLGPPLCGLAPTPGKDLPQRLYVYLPADEFPDQPAN